MVTAEGLNQQLYCSLPFPALYVNVSTAKILSNRTFICYKYEVTQEISVALRRSIFFSNRKLVFTSFSSWCSAAQEMVRGEKSEKHGGNCKCPKKQFLRRQMKSPRCICGKQT